MPASPPIFVSISRSIGWACEYARDSGGGGGCRADTGGAKTGAEDGNGIVPGLGAGTATFGGLEKGALGGTDRGCCESGEGRRVSKEGRSLSSDGGDLSRDGREVETVEGVRVRSNEGRG